MKINNSLLMKALIIVAFLMVVFFAYQGCFSSKYYKRSSSYSLNHEYEIDRTYLHKAKRISSNAELTSLNDEYARLYENKITVFFDIISNYYTGIKDEKMAKLIEDLKDNWEQYSTIQKENYQKLIISKYGSGSIVPVKLSDYNRKINREKAIELYELCLSLNIAVNPL
ncbi:MAG: hypothetical protein IJJ40_03670 [Clostridia bacterium]|nr:hypothetical protein [Clostridia bacterium]